jgi:hypothetical protein
MKAQEFITESAKLWSAQVRINQANYVGYVDAQVWAPNAQVARVMLRQQYNIQDHHVGSVKEIKMKANEFVKEALGGRDSAPYIQYISGPMLPKVNGNYRLQDVLKRVKEIKDAIARAKQSGRLDVNSAEYKDAMAEIKKWADWLEASQDLSKFGNSPPPQVNEAVDESWVQAYQALEDNGGEPTPEKPTLFLKQIAMLVKDAGIAAPGGQNPGAQTMTRLENIKQVARYIANYVSVSDTVQARKVDEMAQAIVKMLPGTPTITQMKQYAQQSQAQTTQFQQQQASGALQHDLSMQQLIRQNQLDAADTEAVLAMDVEARQAILAKKREMELEAQERLAKIEMDIRASREPEAERAQALEMAKMNNAHELKVIQVTAEGEYKKAKLEADYQIQIKQLENIDNAEERQSKLDVINANKAKEIGIINAETQAKIRGLQAETDASRTESDIRVQEAFMMTFKPIWGSLIQSASQLGRTLGQSISAVTGALNRLSKPVMPQAQKPANENIDRLKQLAGR